MGAVVLTAEVVSSSEADIVESLERERSLLLNFTSSGNSSESMSDKGDPDAGVSGRSSSMTESEMEVTSLPELRQ